LILKRLLDCRPGFWTANREPVDRFLPNARIIVLEKLNKRPRPFIASKVPNLHALSGQLAHIWILVLERLDQGPIAARFGQSPNGRGSDDGVGVVESAGGKRAFTHEEATIDENKGTRDDSAGQIEEGTPIHEDSEVS
jgi:hypothetical protein